MLPTECNMPDLSLLQRSSAGSPFLIHQLIGASRDFPPKMASYRRNVVRLADKAVKDYCNVRRLVLLQIAESQRAPDEMARSGRILYAAETTDSLEDCIITTSRLFRYFDRIKNDTSQFPIEKLLKNRVERLEDDITKVRNLIEHLDNDIREDRIVPGQTTAPVLDEKTTAITMAGESMPITALANAVKHFHEFARDFARYRLRPDGKYEHMPSSGPVGV